MTLDTKVVAIIVNYNAGAWLRASVESILGSSITLTLYIVDNASTDKSLYQIETLAERSANLNIIKNPSNLGFARAVNQVIRSVPADYYAIVNPDCTVLKTTIATVISALDQRPEFALGSCIIKNTDGTVQKTCRREFPTPWLGFVRILALGRLFPQVEQFRDFDLGQASLPMSTQEVDAISGAFMVVKKTALDEVGLLDEQYFMHCEDLDWCMRFWNAGYKVILVPNTCVVHAKGVSGRQNKVRVQWHLHRGMVRFYRKFYRERYSAPMMWLVYLGISIRFVVKAVVVLSQSIFTARSTAMNERVKT